jgi:hypothetical protein
MWRNVSVKLAARCLMFDEMSMPCGKVHSTSTLIASSEPGNATFDPVLLPLGDRIQHLAWARLLSVLLSRIVD